MAILWHVIVGYELTCLTVCVVSGSEHKDPVYVLLLD